MFESANHTDLAARILVQNSTFSLVNIDFVCLSPPTTISWPLESLYRILLFSLVSIDIVCLSPPTTLTWPLKSLYRTLLFSLLSIDFVCLSQPTTLTWPLESLYRTLLFHWFVLILCIESAAQTDLAARILVQKNSNLPPLQVHSPTSK